MPPLPDPCPVVTPPTRRWRDWALAPLWVLVVLLALVLIPVPQAQASLLHLEGPIPTDLGVGPNGLAPCQAPAHCAQASWPVADADQALATLLPAVLALDGVDVVDTSAHYLHATLTSRLFGFVDDLELFADGAQGQLHARSQSRLGDSDLGVNARRLERLHRALLASDLSLGATVAMESAAR
jgi:uncharacterized protein (DUF1499 family)